MRQRGWKPADLARDLGEHSATISRLLFGDRKPERSLAAKLFETYGIPLTEWDEPLPRGWKLSREPKAA